MKQHITVEVPNRKNNRKMYSGVVCENTFPIVMTMDITEMMRKTTPYVMNHAVFNAASPMPCTTPHNVMHHTTPRHEYGARTQT